VPSARAPTRDQKPPPAMAMASASQLRCQWRWRWRAAGRKPGEGPRRQKGERSSKPAQSAYQARRGLRPSSPSPLLVNCKKRVWPSPPPRIKKNAPIPDNANISTNSQQPSASASAAGRRTCHGAARYQASCHCLLPAVVPSAMDMRAFEFRVPSGGGGGA
jgi:hypothetical protein